MGIVWIAKYGHNKYTCNCLYCWILNQLRMHLQGKSYVKFISNSQAVGWLRHEWLSEGAPEGREVSMSHMKLCIGLPYHHQAGNVSLLKKIPDCTPFLNEEIQSHSRWKMEYPQIQVLVGLNQRWYLPGQTACRHLERDNLTCLAMSQKIQSNMITLLMMPNSKLMDDLTQWVACRYE